MLVALAHANHLPGGVRVRKSLLLRALPTEPKVESGTPQSKSGTVVDSSDGGNPNIDSFVDNLDID